MMILIAGWFDWATSDAFVGTLAWTLVIVLIVGGFLGTFIPVIPGTTLVFAGILAHYFTMGMEESHLTWPSLIVIAILYILSIVLDWLGGALGAKWFGSSKWGIVGAIVGAIVGMFFGIIGLIVGPLLGVFIFEMFVAKKKVKEAGNSTIGTVVGGLAGIAARVILAAAMIAWYLADVFMIN